ncbi:hypothetical protein [Microbacterium sp. 11MF]|uniref:hypothetical protein n=1 Tax=Microbacterium sp. 11MF TaxID=1169146 RepID=UPI001E647C6D|nr:hypothetical protein [Microbacterium sp. 11MF]
MVSGTDMPSVLLWGTIGLAIVAAIVGLMVWDARRRKSPSVLLDVIAAMARVWVAIVALGIVVTIIRWVSGGPYDLAEMPVTLRWPTELPCQSRSGGITGEGAVLHCAVADSASATVSGLDGGLRALLGFGSVLSLLVAAVPGVVIAVLGQRALTRAPFAARSARWLLVSAIVVLVAGTLGSLLNDVGSFLVAQSVLAEPIADSPVTAPWAFSLNPPVWPLGVALGLGALSVIFQQGARLQRETEGLV